MKNPHHVFPLPVVLMQNVGKRTALAPAFVYLVILEIHTKVAVLNVHSTQIVLLTKLVFGTNVKILALEYVARMQSAK